GGGLKEILGDAERFFDQAVGGFFDHDRAQPHAAPGMRAAADRDPIGIAGNDAHGFDRHAEPLSDKLGEARLMALALRHHANHELDDAVGENRELRFLAPHTGRNIDVSTDRNAAISAALARLAAALLEARPIAELERRVHGADVIAVVVFDTK